jgi:hypothetical protein
MSITASASATEPAHLGQSPPLEHGHRVARAQNAQRDAQSPLAQRPEHPVLRRSAQPDQVRTAVKPLAQLAV